MNQLTFVSESGRLRLLNDDYATPRENVAALTIGLRRAGIALPRIVFDPPGGAGVLARTLMAIEPAVRVLITDIHPDPAARHLFASDAALDATNLDDVETALKSSGATDHFKSAILSRDQSKNHLGPPRGAGEGLIDLLVLMHASSHAMLAIDVVEDLGCGASTPAATRAWTPER
jgi:hypothetical protein